MPINSQFPDVPIDESPFSTQFLENIWQNASKYPNKAALINAHNPEDCVTFRQLYLHIRSLATFLSKRGFGHRDVACIVSQNNWEYVTIFGATIFCGGSLSGASYLFTEYELERQLLDNRASVVFCAEQLLERVKKATLRCPKVKIIVVIGGTDLAQNGNVYSFTEAIKTEPKFKPEINYNVKKDILLIPYSSGTTGVPKGVQLTHFNISAVTAAISAYYDNHFWPKIGVSDSANESILMIMPFYHVYGQSLVTYAMMRGMSVIIMKAFEPEIFCRSIEKYKIKMLKAVPPMVLFLAKSPIVDKYDLTSLIVISSGAAPLGSEVCEEVKKRLPRLKYIVQGFGMSETSVASHIPYLSSNMASCGRLMPNMKMKIIDPKTGKEVQLGQPGEICLKGPNVMLGYLNRPKETSEIIDNEGWLHSGDIGYVDSENNLYIVDRLKELIKVKGLQVPPAELEDLLLGHPSIVDCAVIGVPDIKTGESPKAFVVRSNSTLSEKDVFEYVAERTAKYKHLNGGVQFVESIPRSLAGKILRRELRESKAKL